ncbi:MAG: MBL fold metallo-hydrolase [Halobacteriales archaeon]
MTSQFPEFDVQLTEIPAGELKRWIDANEAVTILDTRRPEDFETWHITGPTVTTVNVPFTAFLDSADEPVEEIPEGVPAPDAGRIVTCCAAGISSRFVGEFLLDRGYDVVGLTDGMRGWAGLYEATDIETDGEAIVRQYHRPSSGCLAYLVVSDGEAAVFDPLRAFANRYPADASDHDAELRYAIDTHIHADHVSGVPTLVGATDADGIVPAGATNRGLAHDGMTLIADGDSLSVGAVTIEAVGLPGHTTEMTGYRIGDVFITGDTVFTDSVARPDLEAGVDGAADAAARLHSTLHKMSSLPEETIVAPAHAGEDATRAADGTITATVGDLRDRLAVFEQSEAAFVNDVVADMPPRPNNYQEIIATNLGKRSVSDTEAFELELGPNNCAVD